MGDQLLTFLVRENINDKIYKNSAQQTKKRSICMLSTIVNKAIKNLVRKLSKKYPVWEEPYKERAIPENVSVEMEISLKKLYKNPV